MNKQTLEYLQKLVENTKDFDAIVSLATLIELTKDLHRRVSETKTETAFPQEEAYLTNITLDRFKNGCVSILRYKYGFSVEDSLSEVEALHNKDYLSYIQEETSVEDYIDEVASCWSV